MQQNHLLANHGEEGAGDAVGDVGANFPEVLLEFAHQRHAQRPAKLGGFDVFSDAFAVVFVEGFEPVTDWFVASYGLEEANLEDGFKERSRPVRCRCWIKKLRFGRAAHADPVYQKWYVDSSLCRAFWSLASTLKH